jgi:hypothetical protein
MVHLAFSIDHVWKLTSVTPHDSFLPAAAPGFLDARRFFGFLNPSSSIERRSDQCIDITCSSPYKMFVEKTSTVGDLTTTCLTVVPLGCYQTKTECCSRLASRWEVLEFLVGKWD